MDEIPKEATGRIITSDGKVILLTGKPDIYIGEDFISIKEWGKWEVPKLHSIPRKDNE